MNSKNKEIKMGITYTRVIACVIAVGFCAMTQQARATLSFYAPYDTNFNLTVGTSPAPTITNGSPGLTSGFALNGMPPRGALDVPGSTNGLAYSRVDNYFTGIGNGLSVGSNTFRLLYKPDYSGVQGIFAARANIFGAGPLASGDSFELYHSDNLQGPTFLMSIANVQYFATLSGFNYNSSTWYYMAGSFDNQGLNFYVQAMTNGSVASFQSVSFGGPKTWDTGFLDSLPLYVGIRPSTVSEGANGDIDDVKVFRNEKWGANDFNFDYAVIIPEGSTVALLTAGASMIFFARRRRTAMNRTLRSVGAVLLIGAIAGAGTASATLSFYAPYDTNLNLAVGTGPVPSSTVGTITLVPGYSNFTGNAANFGGRTSSVNYARSDSYVPDFGNGAVGSNTFRILFKPDFAGLQAVRYNFLGLGGLGFGDGIFLANSDDAKGPGFRVTINGSFKDNIIPNFNWNSNTWYYMGGSLNAQGSLFYIRALTNGAQPITQTVAFGSSTNWGVGGFNTVSLRVSGRYDVNTEGSGGTLDEVKIFKQEKWTLDNFNYDFAVVVPEPSTSLLLLVGIGAISGMRRFKRNKETKRSTHHMKKTLLVGLFVGIGLVSSQMPASATLSFYAPYDNNLNLTVGSPSTVSDSTGTVSIVTGYPVPGSTTKAGDFGGGDKGLAYGNVSSYFTGTTPNTLIGSNSFRLFFNPNFSGPNTGRRENLFGVGSLGATASFYIYNNGDIHGPVFLLTTIGGGFLYANAFSNFNWNSSSWYYLGASFDNLGGTFYVHELSTNTITPTYAQNVSFGGSTSWGGNMGSASAPA